MVGVTRGYLHHPTRFGPIFVYPIIKDLVVKRDTVLLQFYPKMYPREYDQCVVCGRPNPGKVFGLCGPCTVGN